MRTLVDILFSPVTCLLWVIVGAIAGGLAHQLVGRGRSTGFVPDMVLGLIGAVVGGVILRLIGLNPMNGSVYNPVACITHIVVATIGASALIVIGRFISGRRYA